MDKTGEPDPPRALARVFASSSSGAHTRDRVAHLSAVALCVKDCIMFVSDRRHVVPSPRLAFASPRRARAPRAPRARRASGRVLRLALFFRIARWYRTRVVFKLSFPQSHASSRNAEISTQISRERTRRALAPTGRMDFGCFRSVASASSRRARSSSARDRYARRRVREGASGARVEFASSVDRSIDMEAFYVVTFCALACACATMELRKKRMSGKAANLSANFLAFRNNYLVVYALMMAGDWLQGPYVYALYKHYGYSTGDIGKLFIAGFGASMILGTIVGSLADRYGRKRAALTYVASYIASCITKHWSDYGVLMLGRFFGGIATSLLFTAFESWLVSEHFARNYDSDWLNGTFSKAIFIGNGLVSIIAGLLANYLVTDMGLGPVAPFDAAATFLAIGGAIIASTWTENKGAATENASLEASFRAASNAIFNDKKVLYLGAMQSLFEAAMYSFVFLWTPALSPNEEIIPHGMIFATMMVACMIGSSIAGQLLAEKDLRPEKYMQYVFLASAASLSLPILVNMLPFPQTAGNSITLEGQIIMLGFLVFEGLVGIFWPSMMKMRATYVPEEIRSTVMNCFRIPLNLFVCIVLYNVALFPLSAMFAMCTLFLIGAAYLQRKLEIITAVPQQTQSIP